MAVTEEILIGSKADTRGFKKADTAAAKLTKTVKTLAGTLGLAIGTAAIISFGKASIKAFAADEAAARRLATAVDNLGLSLSQSRVTSFIKDLETSAGIADDVLRPAFQALLTTTGSLTKSQELLSNAIQISRASGIGLATVSEDLAKGFVGITRGLKKYNTGLTQAELKSKSFNEILGVMLARSAGAAQDYLTTTSYKMDVLTVAANNAKETIGGGLVDAFARIGGGTEASDAAKAIDNIAKAVNGVTLALGTAIGIVNKFRQGYTNFLIDPFGTGQPASKLSTNRSRSPAGTAARTAQQRQAEAAAAKRAKELEELTKKQVTGQKALTAEQKKQTVLKKAGSIFDLEQIQLIAALKGQLSNEDRRRVELQFALLTGNTKEAKLLTYELAMAQGLGEKIAKDLASLPQAANPFASWAVYLDELLIKARQVASATSSASTTSMSSENYSGQSLASLYAGPAGPGIPTTNIARLPMASINTGLGNYGGLGGAGQAGGGGTIVVQIDGKAIASALQNSSLSGIGSFVDRVRN